MEDSVVNAPVADAFFYMWSNIWYIAYFALDLVKSSI